MSARDAASALARSASSDDCAGGAHRGACCAAGGGTNLEECTHVGFDGGGAPGTKAGAAASTLVAPGRYGIMPLTAATVFAGE